MPEEPTTLPIVTRPTPLSEWTLVGIGVALCLLALIFAMMLLFPHWPDATAAQRVWFLGWSLLLAIGGILLLVLAFVSPWVGTVKATGFGADLELQGKSNP